MFFPQHNSTYKSCIKAISITKVINSCKLTFAGLESNAFKVYLPEKVQSFKNECR